MKKVIALVLAMMLLLTVSASATTYIGFGTGGTSGTYYAFGGDIAGLWNNNLTDVDVTVQSTGGSKANIVSLVDAEIEVAFCQNDVAAYAYAGTDYFDNQVLDNFVGMVSLYPEAVQIVTPADSDIFCVADLKGKNVCVGDIGSGTYQNAIQVLAAAGLTIDDVNATYLSFGEAANSMIDGQIDASFTTAGIPNTGILEVATKMDIRLVQLTDEEWAALGQYPFYSAVTVPAGTYTGMTEDAVIPAVSSMLIVSKDLDEDLVYEMVKTIMEKGSEMTHDKKNEISLETAVNSVTIPFHAGAIKYFSEQGYTFDENGCVVIAAEDAE